MKLLIAAVAASLVATSAFAVTATQKKNAMHHIATAMAAAELCGRVEENQKLIVATALVMHIEFDGRDGEAITADAKLQMQGMKDRSEESVCQAALFMYGPNGEYVKNLVEEK